MFRKTFKSSVPVGDQNLLTQEYKMHKDRLQSEEIENEINKLFGTTPTKASRRSPPRPPTPITSRPLTPTTSRPSTPATSQPSSPVTSQLSTPMTSRPSTPRSLSISSRASPTAFGPSVHSPLSALSPDIPLRNPRRKWSGKTSLTVCSLTKEEKIVYEEFHRQINEFFDSLHSPITRSNSEVYTSPEGKRSVGWVDTDLGPKVLSTISSCEAKMTSLGEDVKWSKNKKAANKTEKKDKKREIEELKADIKKLKALREKLKKQAKIFKRSTPNVVTGLDDLISRAKGVLEAEELYALSPLSPSLTKGSKKESTVP